ARTAPVLAALALLFGAGCLPFRYATPPGFVELNDQHDYDYRAVSAEGVVLSARAIKHDPKGDLDFWSRAVEKEVRLLGGYAAVDRRDVATAAGLKGRQLRFGHDQGQVPYLYQVTLFVTGRWLFLLEAGGSKAEVDKLGPQLDEAL